MKGLIAMVMIVLMMFVMFGCNDVKSEPKKAEKYQACICNFNSCMSRKSVKCASVGRCMDMTADQDARVRGNREYVIVLDSKRVCVNPMTFKL